MKNIETILAELKIELTDEQKTALNKAVAENYKTVAEFDKQVRKLETAEAERDTAKTALDEANKTLDGLKDVDVEGLQKQIDDYKARAEQAEKDAEKKITQRDQEDWLKEKLGEAGYNVKSERVRKSLIADIMDETNGLKWRNGEFLGFADFMAQEKQSDNTIFETAEEKAEREKRDKAQETAPKFTQPSETDDRKKAEPKSIPAVW